jgi:GrpB-like predicted nucleotidyltransferase (UPF0157 family)
VDATRATPPLATDDVLVVRETPIAAERPAVAEGFSQTMHIGSVVVVDYDEEWPRRFEELRARIWPVVADVALGIEHVGSTSVPGLAAKPIIDMTVVVRGRDDVRLAIERLATLGYRHQGTLGIEDREAFEHPADLPRHNLYVCPQGSIGVVNQTAVRDYLRAHPDAARRYAEIKKALALEFPNDIDSYVFGKTDFVLDVLHRAGLSEQQLASIEAVNRRP